MKHLGKNLSIQSAHSLLIAMGLAVAAPAQAQSPVPDAGNPTGLSIELNQTKQVDNNCRLTFTVVNSLDKALTGLVLETVLFDTKGNVQTLTLFDFQSLPVKRQRVRQFDLVNMSCDSLGQILINGVARCEGVEKGACQEALQLSSRVKQEVLG